MKKQPIELSKNCQCSKPFLIGGVSQSMQGHWFQFCSTCKKERKLKAIYENNEIVRFE